MANNYFNFKQFTINQSETAMKVGTDSVLLGAWTKHVNPLKILDIGTGTGILSLMMAQKYQNATITAIEIEQKAYNQAKNNIIKSKWNNRIKVIHQDFIDYYHQSKEKYDIIICNPPYFTKSLKSNNKQRSIARHADLLPFDKLIRGISDLLHPAGIFSLIIPLKEANNLIKIAALQNLHLYNYTDVVPVINTKPIRALLQFGKQIKKIERNNITISSKKRNDYTDEFVKLTKEFYLFL